MKEPSVIPNSVWLDTTKPLSKSKLKADTNADVCIVGAGIAGMTVAYLLGREGKKVIVLDDGPIGGGETGRTTAHLANALDDRYFEIERLHGERGSKLAAESHSRAIDQIEAIVAEEKLDCDFSRVDGYLFVPPGDDLEILERELQACHRAGLSRVRRVPRAPLKAFDTGECLHFPRQAQFHPLKYLAGLTKAIVRDGGRIFTDTHVTEMSGGEQARAATEDGPAVTAQSLVVATNTPILDMVTMHTKQAAYRTYVVGFRIPRASVPQALYWDTPDPYHYVRVQLASDAHDLLIVGGEDHKTGQADDAELRFQALQDWTRQRFPMAGDEEYRWSGQVMEPNDVLAFIGRNPGDQDNVFIVTGDSGNGMTHGTIAGMLLRDLICGRKNCWTELYDPARVTLRAAGEFAKENLNVAAQYGDLVTGGDVDSSDSIEAGSGAILRRGLKKIAAYRDEKGKLHEFSAYCPHLGCVVAWNSTERSWDCPCHGSRFEALGEVINGPAIGPLSPVEE